MTNNLLLIRRAVLVFLISAIAACAQPANQALPLRLLTHRDFHVPEEAITEFTRRTGIEVVIFREPDATAVVDLLIKTRTTPIADVIIGIDSLERRRVTEELLVEPYEPIDSQFLDNSLTLRDNMLTPVSSLEACFNRSVSSYIEPKRKIDELPDSSKFWLPPPEGLDDLLDPGHATSAVIPSPLTSRMGLYFLLALERSHPEDSELPWPEFVDQMVRWGVTIVPTWEQAWFSFYSADQDMATKKNHYWTWGSAGMKAVTVQFQPRFPESLDIAVVPKDCVRVVNYAGLVAGTQERRNAGRLLDAMVEPLFQYNIPDRFGSKPSRTDIARTDAWKAFGETVSAPLVDEWRIGPLWGVWQLTWKQVVDSASSGIELEPPEVQVTLPRS
jgi:thiamine transport system substrate-binding protein